MNCLDFHRLTLSEPDNKDPDYRDHLRQCVACRGFAQRSAAFERQLGAAMAVEVPADLVASIRLEQAIAAERTDDQAKATGRPACRPYRSWALAASLIVAVLAGWLGFQHGQQPALTLSEEVIAHIRGEPDHQQPSGIEHPAKAAQVLGGLGARIHGDLGTVLYAGSCDIRRGKGAHLVLQGERGPVTVLYVPNENPGAVTEFRDGELRGHLHPAGRGSVAVVAGPGEQLGPILARLDRAIAWNP